MKISDVGPESVWICGHQWMRGPESDFPVKTASELVLSVIELQEAKWEFMVDVIERNGLHCDTDNFHASLGDDSSDLDSIRQIMHYISKPKFECHYNFSKYLIDPLKYGFPKVVSMLALVFLFISKLRKGVGQNYNFMKKSEIKIPKIFKNQGDKFILTTSRM